MLSSGAGRALDAKTRAYFEPRFGRDFGGVRAHTGARADLSARRVNSVAYTVGSDVVFRDGAFAPESPRGRRLLAHELAHVVQQSGALARKPDPASLTIAPAGDRLEREADTVADAVVGAGDGACTECRSAPSPARAIGPVALARTLLQRAETDDADCSGLPDSAEKLNTHVQEKIDEATKVNGGGATTAGLVWKELRSKTSRMRLTSRSGRTRTSLSRSRPRRRATPA